MATKTSKATLPGMGQRIQGLRVRLGHSQRKFAELLDVTQGAVSHWETDTIPAAEKLIALASLAGVSVDWLLFGGDKANRPIPVTGRAAFSDDGQWAEVATATQPTGDAIYLPARNSSAFAIQCEGRGLEPRVRPGEYVVVEPGFEPNPGDEVLVSTNDGRAMVKIFLYQRDGRLHLASLNTDRPIHALDRATHESVQKVFAIVGGAFAIKSAAP